jgi:hypothetical protein
MKRISLRITIVILQFAISSAGAHAQQQTLFGERFAPYSEEKRTKAFDNLREMRINRDRIIFGTSNGMLAEELQMELIPPTSKIVPPAMAPAFHEWLEVYPKIPSGSQRFLARHALYLASEIRKHLAHWKRQPGSDLEGESRESEFTGAQVESSSEVANQMVSRVLAAAMSNNWFPYPDLTRELELLSGDQSLDQTLANQARAVLTKTPLEIDSKFDALLRNAEVKVESSESLARVETQRVDHTPYRLSWWPKFIEGNKKPDGAPKEQVAGHIETVTTTVLPAAESAKLIDLMNAITDLYASLPDSSKEVFAGRVLGLTEKLQRSNLHVAADALLWEVFRSIDPTWLENNEIETQLLCNSSFYVQNYDLAKAEKIELKVIKMQDLFYGGIPSNSNLRWVLGDLYDEMGRYDESKKQYEIARQIDERLVRTSIVRADESMDKDYKIRTGEYVPPSHGVETNEVRPVIH